MRYTPFGEFFRVIRVKHHEILSDASSFLHVTSAYISSVECGKRPVPEEWIELISDHYNLSKKDREKLVKVVDESKTSIKLNLSGAGQAQRSAAIQFQRSFNDMDDETAEAILKIIERNQSNGS